MSDLAGPATARLLGTPARPGAGMRLFLYSAGIDLVFRMLGSVDIFQGLGLFGVVPLALLVDGFVRLFTVPGIIVEGASIRDAVR